MTNDIFKHTDPDAFHGKELTLHDCIANQASLIDRVLRFSLPDGFWLTPQHKENKCGKIMRTGAAAVAFSVGDIDDVTVRVFSRNTWCWSTKTRVEDWHIEQLIAAINSKKCTIEFITQYRSSYEQMWHCSLRSKRKPYYRECQLYLPEAEATFFWNDLRLGNEG